MALMQHKSLILICISLCMLHMYCVLQHRISLRDNFKIKISKRNVKKRQEFTTLIFVDNIIIRHTPRHYINWDNIIRKKTETANGWSLYI